MDMSIDYDSIDDGDLFGDEIFDDCEVLEVCVYVVFCEGDLQQVVVLFGELIVFVVEVLYLYYMCGLVYKYLCDWVFLLQDNL